MAKKILLLLSCVFCLQFAVAQTMSDEQIKTFILTEREKGRSQQSIANRLIQMGVSPDRIRNINSDDARETTLMGISNLDEGKTLDSRLREKNEVAQDQEKIEEVEATMEELYEAPKVFGRNIFNNKLLTFESSKNIPIPSDYVLGAGDVVIIDVWGASQNVISAEISPEGKINIEAVGPLYLAGKSVDEANKYVGDVLGKVYAGSNVNLSVGTTRSIIVQVLGEVVAPGSYTMSALSTAFNALYAAGGISDIGTLRAIKVFRNGKNIATIDVYDYIFNGNVSGNVALQDNDIVSVGAYDAIVNIDGKVKRPMMYELKGGEKLSTLVGFSGGFTGDAYSEKLRVVRKSGREYSLFTVERKSMGSFDMCDGDVVYVDSIIPRFSNMVEISGAVFFPGQYQFGDEINSVAKLINAAGGVREEAFLNRAVLHHRNPDNTIEAKSLNLAGIINGSIADVPLRNNDVLFVPSNSEMKGEQLITVSGEVNFPGEYKFAKNTTIEDIILQAGGLTRAASMAKVDVSRQLYDPSALVDCDTIVQIYTFELKDGFVVDGNADFVLEPFDEVNVRRSPVYEKINNVQMRGAVLFEGTYALQSNKIRLSDVVKQAGGTSNSAYIKGAYLMRRATKEELEQREVMEKLSNIELYENQIQENSGIDFSVLESIIEMKVGSSDYYTVAIDLEKAMKDPGCSYDIVMRDGDVVTVPEMVSTVKVNGEVKYPSVIGFDKGKSVKYYIECSGGFSNKAKKNGVYLIHMNGSVEKVSRFSKKAVQPGCEIVIPRKRTRRNLTTGEIAVIGTSTASLATMVITLINMMK